MRAWGSSTVMLPQHICNAPAVQKHCMGPSSLIKIGSAGIADGLSICAAKTCNRLIQFLVLLKLLAGLVFVLYNLVITGMEPFNTPAAGRNVSHPRILWDPSCLAIMFDYCWMAGNIALLTRTFLFGNCLIWVQILTLLFTKWVTEDGAADGAEGRSGWIISGSFVEVID